MIVSTSQHSFPHRERWLGLRWVAALALVICTGGCTHPPPPTQARAANLTRIDETVQLAMAATGAKGLAITVVDGGRVEFTKAYGVRDAEGAPLREDTVMYGASLTKAAFGYLVMQLVEVGRLGLKGAGARAAGRPRPG